MTNETQKTELLNMLISERARWEVLLADLSEERILAPELPGNWSIKDVIAHLTGWQRLSVELLDAARREGMPRSPEWPENLREDEEINQWLFAAHRDQPLSEIIRDWETVFQQVIDLGREASVEMLADAERFDWMRGQPLFEILSGSYSHYHNEHLIPLTAWLADHASVRS